MVAAKKITLAITGASGILFATSLLSELLKSNCIVHLIISKAGVITFHQELGITLSGSPQLIKQKLVSELNLSEAQNLFVYGIQDWYAPMASGSSVDEAMVICPCSMATLAKVACGIGEDLIVRSADVILKERKNLVIVPRETPFSALHLENMLKLARLGVSIIPPIPAFYNHPNSLEDVINSVVSRIMDQLGVTNNLSKRW
jgi:4-hydroxy-3-polyprenylbenzoate decarboxylase